MHRLADNDRQEVSRPRCFLRLDSHSRHAALTVTFTGGREANATLSTVDHSRRVVEWLIDRNATGGLIPLRGNHELMMLAAQKSERHHDEGLACGGEPTFASYRTDRVEDICHRRYPDCEGSSANLHYGTSIR